MRGSVFDTIAIPIALLTFAVAFIIMAVIINALQGTQIDTESGGVITQGVAAMNTFDEMFIFALGILSITAIIAASLINSHPVFLPLNIIVLTVLVFFGFIVTNIYEAIIGNASIAVVAANYPYTTLFFSNLLAYMVVEGGLILFAMHTKTSNQIGGSFSQGGGGMF